MIKDLFDPSKDIHRRIESVVNFADKSEEQLRHEINEYVVTENLRSSYQKVLEELQDAFSNGSNEVGVWISGFYGSGKSSFAKYLGYSFDKSMVVDGISFGEKLMNRVNDVQIKAIHNVISKTNPVVVLIDLAMDAQAGKTASVSDIVYKETMKLMGITSTEPKLVDFEALLHMEHKYDEFVALVKEKKGKDWSVIESNHVIANLFAAELAPIVLPEYFKTKDDYRNLTVESNESEKERLTRMIALVKERTGREKVIFVLDEVGQYIGSSTELINNMQGLMQNIKSLFKGNVWVLATAQQTLTEDNPGAQLNSTRLYGLNPRFPIKVDIEADDIKEIITKRLLGKSPKGKEYLLKLFAENEGTIKLGTKFTMMERSRYIRAFDGDAFANLYPFLPVHIDILLSLLQKLANRTGGAGLRSVIRLIRDLLVDGGLADKVEGYMATPDLFYDALQSNMEKNADFREIVNANKKAVETFSTNPLAVRICKTIAIMQLFDDFNLSFDNLCALLFEKIGKPVDKTKVRELVDQIKEAPGVTLQEIDGRLRFMTNAIISIQEEWRRVTTSEADKNTVMKELVTDLLSPKPAVQIFGSKNISASVDLNRGSKITNIFPGDDIRLNVRFVESTEFQSVHNRLLTESTRPENAQTLFWICTLPQEIETLLIDILRDKAVYNNHRNEPNKEIKDYLKGRQDDEKEKRSKILRLLKDAQNNSETICKGSPMQVNADTYCSVALKNFAEQVYHKYALANRNMSANCVNELFSVGDGKVPESLNPFKIVGDDGGINTQHLALIELKDYIASASSVLGSQLLDRFSRAEYGWSKETVRYLVALMLKASMIELRSGAQQYHMFTKNAADAMKNNTSFGHIGISISTQATLSQQELLKARTLLVELYNAGNVLPLKDKIANAANRIFGEQKPKIEKLIEVFSTYHIAGIDKLTRARGYMERILESEGADAPVILATESDCEVALRYSVNVMKQNILLDNIKKIAKRLDEASKLPEGYFPEFRSQMSEVEVAFNVLKEDPDFYTHGDEFADLVSRVNLHIEQVCAFFQQKAQEDIDKKNEEILKYADYITLPEEMQEKVNAQLKKASVSLSETLEKLHESFSAFSGMFIPGGFYSNVSNLIANLNEQYKQQQSGGAANEPTPPKTHHRKVKKLLTSRQDVQSLISELQALLSEYNDGDTVEFNIE